MAVFVFHIQRERPNTLSSTTTVCFRFRHAASAAGVPPRRPDGWTARSYFATRTCSSATRRTPTPSAQARLKPQGAQPSQGAKKSKSGGTQYSWERKAGAQPTASTTSLVAQRSKTTKASQHRHGTGSSSRVGERSSSSGVSPPLLLRSVRKRTIPQRKRRPK